jgi:hypothetical protein
MHSLLICCVAFSTRPNSLLMLPDQAFSTSSGACLAFGVRLSIMGAGELRGAGNRPAVGLQVASSSNMALHAVAGRLWSAEICLLPPLASKTVLIWKSTVYDTGLPATSACLHHSQPYCPTRLHPSHLAPPKRHQSCWTVYFGRYGLTHHQR